MAGDTVVIGSGRHRGATAVVVRLASLPTPSGGSIRMAEVERPRAGRSWEFLSDLRKPEEVPTRTEVPDAEAFR